MNRALIDKYEFKDVARLLNALQLFFDNSIYSKETPMEGRAHCARAVDDLQSLIAPSPINKKSIRVILDNVHINLLGFARESLPVEHDESPYN